MGKTVHVDFYPERAILLSINYTKKIRLSVICVKTLQGQASKIMNHLMTLIQKWSKQIRWETNGRYDLVKNTDVNWLKYKGIYI